LLQDVRNVALEHELRREGILRELQAFAARMGALPMPRQPYASLENAPVDVPAYETNQPAPRTGDWRQAAANLREHLPNLRSTTPGASPAPGVLSVLPALGPAEAACAGD